MRSALKPTKTKIILLLALILGTFLRFWNFTNTFQFLGDQGRDSMVALRIIKDHHPALIGPVTSTGNMYLGPLYYYFMVPFLYLTYPSPLGPGYAIAVLSILTIFLIYQLGKELVGERAALIAAIGFTFSEVAVTFARFSWNPNPAPFVSIILLWATYRAWKKNIWYFILVSVCISVMVQLHYVTLLTIGGAGVIWLIKLRELWLAKKQLPKFAMITVFAIAIFVASFTPLVLFDLRHNFLNFHAFLQFLNANGTLTHTNSFFKIVHVARETDGRARHALIELFIGVQRYINPILLTIITTFLFFFLMRKKQPYQEGIQLLCIYLVTSVIGLAFYESTIFDHYIIYLLPVSLLLYGVIGDELLKNKIGKIVFAVGMLGFIIWNCMRMPFDSQGWTVTDVQSTAQTITNRVRPGEKYNIVLLTETGDIEAQNYRYFLQTTDKPPLPQEQWGETDTLFIINEDHKIKNVTSSPIYEIVVFPNKTPSEVYTIPNGPEITVLRR